MSGIVYMPTPREERMILVRGVAKQHGVTVAQIMGRSRLQEIVEARWAAMRMVQVVYGDSYSRIGRLFGRDHATVMHAIRRLAT